MHIGRSIISFSFAINLVILPLQMRAQTSDVVGEVLNQMLLQTTDEEDMDIITIEEDLNYFIENPIDLNNATKQDLERLPFLSPQQIEEILFYAYQYGEIYTLDELFLIDGMDTRTIELLTPFVTVLPKEKSPVKIKDVFKYGKHEILIANNLIFEKRKGYIRTKEQLAETPTSYYVGDPVYASLKYNFHYKDAVQFGFSAEKDAGENFTGPFHKGYDSYNGYIQLKNIWKFKTIVAGNYRATFGQGLVLRTEFSLPEFSVTHISPRNTGLRKTSSTNEYHFMRGIGMTLKLNGFSITPFYSYRHMDADIGGGSFSTIITTGLHRSVSELAKRRTLPMHVVGANVGYDWKSFHVGATSSTVIYGFPQVQNGALYTQMLDTGKVQSALSIDYSIRLHRFSFFGETAICTNRGLATINAISYSPLSLVEILFSHRYYSPHYDVPFSNGYGGRTNNENGFYLAFQLTPMRRLKLSAAADAYYRPWLSYNVDKSMVYYKFLLRAEYMHSESLSMLGQFTYRSTEKNLIEETPMQQTGIVRTGRYLYRLNCDVAGLQLKTRLEMNHAKEQKNSTTFGFLVAQNFAYTVSAINLTFDVLCCYFSAKNYNNRFQIYERNVPNQMSVPLLYGEGVRYHLLIGYKAPRIFSFYARIAQTYYTDSRTEIGSGKDTIKGNHRTDLQLFLRFSI